MTRSGAVRQGDSIGETSTFGVIDLNNHNFIVPLDARRRTVSNTHKGSAHPL